MQPLYVRFIREFRSLETLCNRTVFPKICGAVDQFRAALPRCRQEAILALGVRVRVRVSHLGAWG